ncbi:uncharacterized protein PHACADRAFT_206370 [Phanerochaete carnosa HHB-10118-sp]|uniref:DUF6535 domain-containing protein n=1 Tax=Phanerochaete carnosa (strain HHB-10118-sp) TaxID=650164 RepID=K5W0W1_PHACS|nr:uncharacterized protein PHACADRAFT_206370 [Phanerochaete carnosa HHB-10118-sp]EKM57463.1 hypothetical protein PHACADRAFT_206370 [Phanerochaete carnosa HHB-10118-sp]
MSTRGNGTCTVQGFRIERAEDPGAKDTSGLSCWAGIEDTVAKDDKGKMDRYSDDLDTLLVVERSPFVKFACLVYLTLAKAGLFSAILSAFVVRTYQMLQPSSADLTNQLLTTNNQMLAQNTQILAQNNQIFNQILAQGFSTTLAVSTFSPPQLLSPTGPPPFQPSTPARWINTPFFISLVLSLAAALLGILVKQWVREYMWWNSPLATPRENIMVRQFRFEAWEAWNVTAVVLTVPPLLEVAMILFLIGMLILLWTLDDIVAICLTALTAMFLLMVAAFTVLPVFSHRCPYKSPTARAATAAFGFMSHLVPFCLSCAEFMLLYYTVEGAYSFGNSDTGIRNLPGYEQRERVEWKRIPHSWRDVDLSSRRTMLPRFGSQQLKYETLHTAAERTLSAETSHGSKRKVIVDELSVEVKETVLLLRVVMCGPGLKAREPAKPGPKSLTRAKPGSGLKAGLGA